jgi:hypothetical protein
MEAEPKLVGPWKVDYVYLAGLIAEALAPSTVPNAVRR